MRGWFITFEGGEGSGKSTQLNMLREYLQRANADFVYTREPGGTDVSEKIRNLVLDVNNKSMVDECEALLYSAARAQLVKEFILPAVEGGKLVVCDRYIDSSVVYQGYARGLGVDFVEKINAYAVQNCMPDVTFFLDISPKDAFARKGGADKDDRLEMSGQEFHQKVYEGYLLCAEKYPDRIIRIDSTLSAQEVHDQIIQVLKSKGIIA